MDILVTGANGFIGRTFIPALLDQKHKVFALDIVEADGLSQDIEKFYLQDITKEFKLNRDFDVVFHLAACNLTHIGKVDYNTYFDVNVRGTENLIKSTDIENFVYLSTTKVYEKKGELIDEQSPLSPIHDYEKSKLEAEDICKKYFKKESLTIFRSINIVGEEQPQKAVLPVFFKRAMQNQPLEIIGSSKTKVQLLYIKDVIKAFCLLLEKGKSVGITNLSCEETIELIDLARKVIKICNSSSKLICCDESEVHCPRIDVKKANDLLGWQAETSIDEILKKYYQHCQKRG